MSQEPLQLRDSLVPSQISGAGRRSTLEWEEEHNLMEANIWGRRFTLQSPVEADHLRRLTLNLEESFSSTLAGRDQDSGVETTSGETLPTHRQSD